MVGIAVAIVGVAVVIAVSVISFSATLSATLSAIALFAIDVYCQRCRPFHAPDLAAFP